MDRAGTSGASLLMASEATAAQELAAAREALSRRVTLAASMVVPNFDPLLLLLLLLFVFVDWLYGVKFKSRVPFSFFLLRLAKCTPGVARPGQLLICCYVLRTL